MFDPTDPVARDFRDTAVVHYRSVFRVARFLARDPGVAEDLTQDTFLRAWTAFPRFQQGTNCRAWLIGILYHVWSHERRRRGRTPVLFDSDAVAANVVVYSPPTPEGLTDEAVLAAFEAMAPELREVVLLADVEELKYREIAALLDIPLGTVMSRLNRARRSLRQALAAERRQKERSDAGPDAPASEDPKVKARS